jgi:hypothetical protein
MEVDDVEYAKEFQHYRLKSQLPVCGNCKFLRDIDQRDCCGLGKFQVDIVFGTCADHEWRK